MEPLSDREDFDCVHNWREFRHRLDGLGVEGQGGGQGDSPLLTHHHAPHSEVPAWGKRKLALAHRWPVSLAQYIVYTLGRGSGRASRGAAVNLNDTWYVTGEDGWMCVSLCEDRGER